MASGDDKKSGIIGKAGEKATETTAKAAQAAVASLNSAMEEYVNRVKAAQTPHAKLLDSINKMRDANEALVKAGGDFYTNFAPGGAYNRSMQQIITLSQDFFGNANAGVEAMSSLAINMKSFVGVSAEAQKSMAEASMYMGQLGFNIDQVAKAFENQAMAFGSSEKDLKSYALTMSKLSNTLFIEPTKLMENFDHAQQNFAYNAEQTLDVFVRLQEQSRKSGVEFGTMASTFGDGMDKFDGVASLAGRLNAILGSSVFNPMQLLNMDEAERAEAIRKGIQDSPMLGGRDINQLGKFELRAFADTLNMSVLETRKFLTNQGDIRSTFQSELDRRMGPAGGVEGLSELQATDQELLRMQDTIRNLRTDMENFYIDGSKVAAEKFAGSFVAKLAENVGIDTTRAREEGGFIFSAYMARQFGAVDPLKGVNADDQGRMIYNRYNKAGDPRLINPGLTTDFDFETIGAATETEALGLTGRQNLSLYTRLGPLAADLDQSGVLEAAGGAADVVREKLGIPPLTAPQAEAEKPKPDPKAGGASVTPEVDSSLAGEPEPVQALGSLFASCMLALSENQEFVTAVGAIAASKVAPFGPIVA